MSKYRAASNYWHANFVSLKSTRKSPIDIYMRCIYVPIESSLDRLARGHRFSFFDFVSFTIDLFVRTGPVWSIYLDKRTI